MKLGGFLLIGVVIAAITLPAAARDVLLINNGLTSARYDCATGESLGNTDFTLPGISVTEPSGMLDVAFSSLVRRYDASGAVLGDIQWPSYSYYGTFQGLTWGPDGYLYAANTSKNCIQRMNPVTGECNQLNLSVSILQPMGITFGTDGDLYVCANYDPRQGGRQIARFSVSNGSLVQIYKGTKDLTSPQQLVTGSNGSIYALNQCAFGLYKLNSQLGEFDEVSPGPLGGPGGGFFEMAANPAGGLFLSTFDSKTSRFPVYRYDTTTGNLSYLATSTTGHIAVVSSVPEPSSTSALLLGLTGLGSVCLKRRSKFRKN